MTGPPYALGCDVSEIGTFNSRIIREFRANKGKVGRPFEGAPVMLITATGARSGKLRSTPSSTCGTATAS
jgi:hypothetical protein